MKEKLQELCHEALQALDAAGSLEDLNETRIKYLGKKGALTQVLRGMGKLSAEEAPPLRKGLPPGLPN